MHTACAKSSSIIQSRLRVCGSTFLHVLFAIVITLAATGYGAAQTLSEVHILPRSVTGATPGRSILRANVDLVLVNVTVLDRAGRAVTGLEPTNFLVQDDNNPQVVRYLSNIDEPISLAVVLDASASMAPRLKEELNAVGELVNASNPQDDFSLIIVSDEPRVALNFGESTDEIQQLADTLQPEGATALWDAMYLGLKELQQSRYQRKAMIVISDGGDNHSRYTESELKSLLKEADVEVYAIGLFNRYAARLEEKKGPLQLDEVASITGGRVISAPSSPEMTHAVTEISLELRSQYVLGFYPDHRSRDGKWRKLRVRLTGSASQGSFRLYARKGYYVSAE